jgi:uncharacterized lipoprotein NlpE involved in copper resistance
MKKAIIIITAVFTISFWLLGCRTQGESATVSDFIYHQTPSPTVTVTATVTVTPTP